MSRSLIRTTVIIRLVLMSFSLILAACGGAATQAPATQPPITEAPTEAPTQATEAPTEVPTTGGINCMDAQPGDTITMLYPWSGAQEASLHQVLQPLMDACGILLDPESTSDLAVLATRVASGDSPDVAFWWNDTPLVQYQDQLMSMGDLGANPENYRDYFVDLGTVNQKWLGLPVNVDVRTIIWYNPANFDALGYLVPTTWGELDALVEQMAVDGNVPWSMGFEAGGATGWTGSDFIQDILLVQQGPQYVTSIIDGSTPYNDVGVKQAYETYGKWAKDPKYTVGGAEGTLSTLFLDAIYKPFAEPPEAMMVKQSSWAGAEIARQFPNDQFGIDYDFFVVPGAQGLQVSVGGWMMVFTDKPAVKALVAYLSSPEGGANWTLASFGLSPNLGAAGFYTDPLLQKLNDELVNAESFTPDLGDTISDGFQTAEWKAIVDYVSDGGDLDAGLDSAAAAQILTQQITSTGIISPAFVDMSTAKGWPSGTSFGILGATTNSSPPDKPQIIIGVLYIREDGYAYPPGIYLVQWLDDTNIQLIDQNGEQIEALDVEPMTYEQLGLEPGKNYFLFEEGSLRCTKCPWWLFGNCYCITCQ